MQACSTNLNVDVKHLKRIQRLFKVFIIFFTMKEYDSWASTSWTLRSRINFFKGDMGVFLICPAKTTRCGKETHSPMREL